MNRVMVLWVVLLAGCGGGSYEHEGTSEGAGGFSDYRNQGIEQLEGGRVDKAIDLFTIAILNKPSDAEAYYHRGNAWLIKREPDKALSDYGDAVRVNCHHKRAWFKMGYAYHNFKGDYEAALEALNEAVKEDKIYGDAYLWRGINFRSLKVFNSAVADLEAAVRHGCSTAEFKEMAARELAVTRQMAESNPK